jgi:two-component system chemotaxis sensor kinase CheA
MTSELDVKEFMGGYLAEAEEHLSSARANLLSIDDALREGHSDPRGVRELFRNLHTLKGLSAMVGADSVVDLAHEMESLLRLADRGAGKLPAEAVDAILHGVHAIEERVASLQKGEPLTPAPKALLERLASFHLEAADAPATGTLSIDPDILAKMSVAEQEQFLRGVVRGRRGVSLKFVPSEARTADGLTITTVRERLAKLGEIVKVVPRSVPATEGNAGRIGFILLVLTDASDEALAAAAAVATDDIETIRAVTAETFTADDSFDVGQGPRRNFVRVDVSRLDDALERLSALVVTRSRLQLAIGELANGRRTIRDLMNIVGENGRQLRDLRGAIMRARMVPVEELLNRAPLLVRGLSKASHKIIRLSIDAGQSELDKAVADRLFGAVVHLLRNAVDHAIELPEERRRAGKPAEGHLQVACFDRADSRLELTVADDGRGVDRREIANRAGCAVPRDDAELLDLMTRPGLSTMDKATHTSGRGMGMDIVKRIVVDELGGEMRLRTTPGAGAVFTLIVPLSIAVVDVFSFTCSDRKFVVPVSAVDELLEVDPEHVSDSPDPHRHAVAVKILRHRGAAVPLFPLSSLLGLAAKSIDRPKAILVKRNAENFAFQVDTMLGQQDVVVRPLIDPLVQAEGVAGSTDLGDGHATLVLDLLGLLRKARAATKGLPS